MRANPIVAGLWIALIALLGAGVALVRSRRAPPPAIEPPEEEPPAAPRYRPPPMARRPSRRARPTLPACTPKPGAACAVGRVEFPRDVPEHPRFEDLSLAVIGIDAAGKTDGVRYQDGEIGADGVFRLDLAPGDYDLEVGTMVDDRAGAPANDTDDAARAARADAAEGFTGGRDLLRAEAGAVIDDVVIAVRRAVSIRGALRGVQGLPASDATITIHRTGRPDATKEISPAADGRFRLGGLRAGSYDISVNGGSSYRRRALSGVSAPAHGLLIELARRPILLGAVGASPDGACPRSSLRLGDGAAWSTALSLGDLCAFSSEPLPDGDRLRLEGTVGDTPISQWLTIPTTGDPTPVCLLGPCAPQPGVLAVAVVEDEQPQRSEGEDEAEGERESGTITTGYALLPEPPGDESLQMGESSGAPLDLTYFYDLPVGRTLRLWAEHDGRRVEELVTVGPGVNEIVLHLPLGAGG